MGEGKGLMIYVLGKAFIFHRVLNWRGREKRKGGKRSQVCTE